MFLGRGLGLEGSGPGIRFMSSRLFLGCDYVFERGLVAYTFLFLVHACALMDLYWSVYTTMMNI